MQFIILKGIISSFSSVSIEQLILGSLKCESFFVAPCPGKCLTTDITLLFCKAFMYSIPYLDTSTIFSLYALSPIACSS